VALPPSVQELFSKIGKRPSFVVPRAPELRRARISARKSAWIFLFGASVFRAENRHIKKATEREEKKMKKSILRALSGVLLALSLAAQALAAPAYLIPGGNTVGIKLYAEGLLVTSTVEHMPAQEAGIRRGDTILQINGERAASRDMLASALQTGSAVELTVLHAGREAELLVCPDKTDAGYRLGANVRDGIAGIGTVTYYDPETGAFGALGHGVSEPDSTALLPTSSGFLVRSRVAEVQKGRCGAPGALKGEFDVSKTIGTVGENRAHGIFGRVSEIPDQCAVPVAKPQEVRAGEATILANVEGGKVEPFSVRIDRLYPGAASGRNLLLTVTDSRLLALTGGIVQGMSGSPILQGGKLVGAVTHVCVIS
jgi:stage IV sporulation protein B